MLQRVRTRHLHDYPIWERISVMTGRKPA